METKSGRGQRPEVASWLGRKGNESVTGVKQSPGAIGYTELSYSSNNHLPVAEVKNKDGPFHCAIREGGYRRG